MQQRNTAGSVVGMGFISKTIEDGQWEAQLWEAGVWNKSERL